MPIIPIYSPFIGETPQFVMLANHYCFTDETLERGEKEE